MSVKETNSPEKSPDEIKAELKAKKEAAEKAMTKEVYSKTVKENEKHLFHVKLDKPNFDKTTGEKNSVAFVQKFHKSEYEQILRTRLGYQITVLWSPDDLKAELLEKQKLAEKAKADAAKKLAEQQLAADKANKK